MDDLRTEAHTQIDGHLHCVQPWTETPDQCDQSSCRSGYSPPCLFRNDQSYTRDFTNREVNTISPEWLFPGLLLRCIIPFPLSIYTYKHAYLDVRSTIEAKKQLIISKLYHNLNDFFIKNLV